jgi:hypothetical protein
MDRDRSRRECRDGHSGSRAWGDATACAAAPQIKALGYTFVSPSSL